MTLKLKADPTYFAKVEIPTPNGAVEIKVEYKHMTRDAYKTFLEAEAKLGRSDEESLMDIMAGWAGVDAEFSKEAVSQLCQQYHAAPRAIVEGFIYSLTQSRLGN